MALDFQGLAAQLLGQARTLLPSWFPEGKIVGHEFEVGDLSGKAGSSLKVNIRTGKWADFASGDAGIDLISLFASMERISQGAAYIELGGEAEPARSQNHIRRKWTVCPFASDDASDPPNKFSKRMTGGEWKSLHCVTRWAYHTADRKIAGWAVRFESYNEDGEIVKDVIPQVWCRSEDGEHQWMWKSMPEPRPPYHLHQLVTYPDKPVMIVEGEKSADAAAKIVGDRYVVTTWAGGSKAIKKTDWAQITGRKILLWPDADEPGRKAMVWLARHLYDNNIECKIILSDDHSDGWDSADALADGWDWEQFREWARKNVVKTGERNAKIDTQVAGNGQDRVGATPTRGAARASQVGNSGVQRQDRRAEPTSEDDEGRVVGLSRGELQRDSERQAGEAGADSESAAGGERDPVQIDNGADGPDLRTHHPDQPINGQLQQLGDRSLHSIALIPTTETRRVILWGELSLELAMSGIPVPSVNNAMWVLHKDPALKGMVWFDEFLQRILTGDKNSPDGVRDWNKADDIWFQLYLQRVVGLSRIAYQPCCDAVKAYAQQNTRNCVAEWMRSLEWDGVDRLSKFFHVVYSADDNEYTNSVSRNFWISMIARTMRPGCQVDNMVILEGGQGTFKSTSLNLIAGSWFCEMQESARNSKAFAEILQGKLLVEVSELDAFSRAESNTVKRVITTKSDRYRDAYGTTAVDHLRRCIMVGTTNESTYNRDHTGARRQWPILCGVIDMEYLREFREQLFAEAVVAFDSGEHWWITPSIQTKAEQMARYDNDPWHERIEEYVEARLSGGVDHVRPDAIADMLGITADKMDEPKLRRIRKTLTVLGLKSQQRRIGKIVKKVWVRVEDREDTEQPHNDRPDHDPIDQIPYQ